MGAAPVVTSASSPCHDDRAPLHHQLSSLPPVLPPVPGIFIGPHHVHAGASVKGECQSAAPQCFKQVGVAASFQTPNEL
jgi:hypothetical protein